MSAALGADESVFAALAERHRRELHVHCYRILASFDDAEDAVRETFLRAWRGRDTFEGCSAPVPRSRNTSPRRAPSGRLAARPDASEPMPTAASYLRLQDDSEFRAFKLDVLRIENGAIKKITTFNAELFPGFGLPPTL